MTNEVSFEIFPGSAQPFGATVQGEAVNFAFYSRHATNCTLVLFRQGEAAPYAKAVGGRAVWGARIDVNDPFQHRGRITDCDFDWGDDHPLRTPIEDLVIYEMHVRGFTRHQFVPNGASHRVSAQNG